MSGDVQPRKRKDKKRKKEELGVEEPRGTATVFGEGDVYMHSHHEHGTGGHWCAKIIFFSLLAVLVTLVGLIILENRGLSDLEAKSVESRYSGVLEGWLEDAPDDGHHDEHTLELKHHDDVGKHENVDKESQEVDQEDDEEDHDDEHEEADDQDDEVDQDDDQSDDQSDDDEDDQEDEDDAHENDDDDDNSEEQNLNEADEDDDEETTYRRYVRSADEYQQGDDDEDNDDDLQKVDENDSVEDNDENDQDDRNYESQEQDGGEDQSEEENDQSPQEGDDDKDRTVEDDDESNDHDNNYVHYYGDDDSKEDDDNSNEDEQNENDTREDENGEEHDDEEGDSGVEVEKLEREISDEDALSTEEPEQHESKEDDNSQDVSNEATPEDDGDDDEEYLELDEIDEPPPFVEHIKVPAGKPLAEVEEGTTTVKPQDTLAEEEEYERQQEQIRREEADASHVWLKLVVGGALLAATHAVVRRTTAPRDAPDEHASREETPVNDRRMTLIPEEAAAHAISTQDLEEPVIEDEIVEKFSSVIKSTAPVKQESDEEDDDVEEIETQELTTELIKDIVDKELYSDEEDADDGEEEEIVVEEKEPPKPSEPVAVAAQTVVQTEPGPEEELPDDVEIIDDEVLEEELEEEEEEDDISDVDDAELLSRLEAKYGRLPEPERPGQKHKDGGNSIEDDWPGEPSDAYWRQQLDQAEQELRQGSWSSARERASAPELSGSARGRWLRARALDASAEARRDNALLSRAIAGYLDLLKMNERLGDNILRRITDRTLDRIRFRGSYLNAEPVYRLLIRRFPDVPEYRNNLTVTFLMANRADLAEESIKETLKRWPDDRVALAHYGFVLKTQHNRPEEAVVAFQKALKGDVGPATEPRFYYHLGDSLLMLGRNAEAHEVHKRGAALGHFLSPAQRSLYNVDRLKGRPWWTIEQTTYSKLARALEKSWKEILKEGEAARALYELEKEGLRERGEWSQLDLFVRGQEVPDRCTRAPVTCAIVRSEPAASGCRRGQVKFSSMEPGTHVRPHVGPTNCRLRMHLGLSNTKDTFIRVDKETRQWQAGKVLVFDDSFEHEVWHNGSGTRLVLIVDVWHPGLQPAQRRALPAI